MFDIEYKGANAVVIATKKAKLISDPMLSVAGGKDISTKDAVVIATEERLALNSPDALLNIEGPGEYEVADFSITGVAAVRHIDQADAGKNATIYRIEVGDVRIALLGNVDAKLSEDQLEAIGIVDVVILPVGGGGYTLDATAAAQLVRAIDAKVVIPIHYADKGLSYEVPQDELETFKKELGGDVEQTAKLKVKSASALPTTLTTIELTRS